MFDNFLVKRFPNIDQTYRLFPPVRKVFLQFLVFETKRFGKDFLGKLPAESLFRLSKLIYTLQFTNFLGVLEHFSLL